MTLVGFFHLTFTYPLGFSPSTGDGDVWSVSQIAVAVMTRRCASQRLASLLSLVLPCSLPWAAAASGTVSQFHISPDTALPRPFGVPLDSHRFNAQSEAQVPTQLPATLEHVLDAMDVMQREYFEVFTGTWPSAIDWTAAVIGTHISATLSSLVSSMSYSPTAEVCNNVLAWENIFDRYFAHTSIFYFGENAFGLRNQAYDDMLWVVLGWLENVKFIRLQENRSKSARIINARDTTSSPSWHGSEFIASAAHRARIFYDLASTGWDTTLCQGGMIWNPHMEPYKNAITNELFISASIAMYLYFPGDSIDYPYMTEGQEPADILERKRPRNPKHLSSAITAYDWLQYSHMEAQSGLYADGFHIRGWRRFRNGTINPGTGNCDSLNHMVYTYNQGVILSGLRGLWIATGNSSYLEDGHRLVRRVMNATGWQSYDDSWHGLGRNGILEEFCDHTGRCSQDGQTFKGIFFHHLAEFCRPLWPSEEEVLPMGKVGGEPDNDYQLHQFRCAGYGLWIIRNAQAALMTRDEKGRFGMWWGRAYPDTSSWDIKKEKLSTDAVDYRNMGPRLGKSNESSWKDVYGEDRSKTLRAPDHTPEQDPGLLKDMNGRGRGRTVETQSGGLAVLRALWQWENLAGGNT